MVMEEPHDSSSRAEQDSRVRVEIIVQRAVNLPNVGSLRKHAPDVYVEVSLGKDKKRTKTAKGSCNPGWDESFVFYSSDPSTTLTMEVYAQRTVHKDIQLGRVSERVASFVSTAGDDVQIRKIASGSELRFIVNVTGAVSDEVMIKDRVDAARTGVDRMAPASSKVVEEMERVEAPLEAVKAIGDAVSPISTLLDGLDVFCKIMDGISEVHPYAKAAWSTLSSVYKTYRQQLDADNSLKNLFAEMTSLYSTVNELKHEEGGKIQAMATSQEELLPQITKETKEWCEFIEKYASHRFVNRMARGVLTTDNQRINDYCDSFQKLKSEFFDYALQWGIHLMISRTWREQQSLAMRDVLDNLPRAKQASVLELDACLPHTRTELLSEVRSRFDLNNGQQIFFLTGPSGSGKSAVASSVARQCKADGCLGASFAFRRGQQDRTPGKLLSAIARGLAEFNEDICRNLYELIQNDTDLRETENPERQLSYLLGSVEGVSIDGPVVIVIDALDEGGDAKTRRLLFRLLTEFLTKSPHLRFRIFITSRPEYDILEFTGHHSVFRKDMGDVPSTNEDISRYIYQRLASSKEPGVEEVEPEEHYFRRIAEISQGLFQFASLACESITMMFDTPGFTRQECYEQFIGSSSNVKQEGLLDYIYKDILSRLFPSQNPSVIGRFKTVMAIVIASFEPLSINSINALLEVIDVDGGKFKAELILRHLGSLLSGVSATDAPIIPLHTSFRDFSTEHSRSGDLFFVDLTSAHKQLALASLRIMQNQLKFNICKLETSYQRNREILDLAKRIEDHIPAHLSYACCYGIQHACISALVLAALDDSTWSGSMKALLMRDLLYWFEALSLLNAVPGVRAALLELEQLITADEELRDLLHDVLTFLTICGPAITESAPHVYLSALPFASPDSLVSKQYIPQFPNMLHVCNPVPHWPDLRRSTQHGRPVWAVAVSPNSRYIASGCDDGTLWIRNAQSGMLIHGPLHGHQKRITSITFSADSTLLATGSNDQTIRLWDVAKGEALGEPLVGHTDSVLSVIFLARCPFKVLSASEDRTVRTWDIERAIAQTMQTSPTSMISSHSFQHDSILCTTVSPDSVHFASGGCDGRIMLWSINPGEEECQGKALLGHSREVHCVAFSAESRYLASGSDDCMVRVWDLTTQEVVGGPLKGHTNVVRSVVFSPRDSTCVASGSEDSTVRIWSVAAEGHQQIRVLWGHMLTVLTLAYTVDGTHLVSGSGDGTARMWRVDEAEDPGNEEQTQSGPVRAACFSPDGVCVVSGSDDGALRVWDAATGKALCKPLTGHANWLRCVAFSRYGAHIVTGSDDKTLRWWDSKTYEAIGEPLDAQAGYIRAVGFTKNGAQIIVIGKDGVRLFDAQTRELADDQLGDQLEDVYQGAISADGSLVACGVLGESDCDFRVWDLETRDVRCQFSLEKEGYTLSMAFSPDGASLLVAIFSTVMRADVMTGVTAEWKTVNDYIRCLASSPTGNYIVAGTNNGSVYVWDHETGALVARFVSPELLIIAVAFSRDARQVAGGTFGSFRLWDMPLENGGITDSIERIIFSSEREHALPRKREHALPNAELLYQSFPSSTGGCRPIIQLDNDGWVKATVFSDSGEESRLLFWVPAHYGRRLTILGRLPMNNMEPVHLDLRNFTHGLDWSRCYVPTSISGTA